MKKLISVVALGVYKLLKKENTNPEKSLDLDIVICDSNDNLLIKDCDANTLYRFNKYLIDRGFSEKMLIDCKDSKPIFDGQPVYFEEYDYSIIEDDFSFTNGDNEDDLSFTSDDNEDDSKSLNNTVMIAKKCCEDVTSKFRENNINFQCNLVDLFDETEKKCYYLNNCRSNLNKFKNILENI
jgi:hypothetical protein